jgi:tartrate dehydratase beta subunit/fumarate hydratase class I family protein
MSSTPTLIERGLRGMIGKGNRSPEVVLAIKRYVRGLLRRHRGIAALSRLRA